MTSLTIRSIPSALTCRDADSADGRTITGLAVPFDTPTTIVPGFAEQIARGAIDLTSEPALFYRHGEPIGVITAMRETDQGLEIDARISDTSLGRDAATLAADKAIRSLSIGFYEREYEDATLDDGTVLRTQTSIDLREVSLVPAPAYPDAQITNVRHTTIEKETPMTDSTAKLTEALDALAAQTRADSEDLARRLALIEANTTPTPGHGAAETRSAGTLIKAAIGGDTSAREALAPYVGRAAFSGTTTAADARYTTPTFVRDLTRLIDNANPLMRLFATDALPAEGNTLEYARLKSNTLKVGKQAKEGDALPTGGISTEVATTTIDTYGGGTVLSIQTIERSRANILDLSLRGLAIEAGKQLAGDFAAFFEKTVKAQSSATITATKAADALDWKALLHLMLDASDAYEDLAMTCDGLIVNRATFEAIAGMTGTDNRPILQVASNDATNAIGTVSASGKYASLDGLKIITNRHLTIDGMGEGVVGAFYNSEAIRVYKSGLASLQDTGVLDLTGTYSVYQYAAFADEIPSALVPLKMGA